MLSSLFGAQKKQREFLKIRKMQKREVLKMEEEGFRIRLSGFEKNDPISPKRTRQKDIVISNARQFHI